MTADTLDSPLIVRRLLPEFGTTYGPAGDGKWPSVLLLHGSEGGWAGWSHRNAVFLAAHGFLAFPFGYSSGGNTWNAGSIENVELTQTAKAVQALRDFAFCDGRVALFGNSRGGEHALLVSSLMALNGMEGLPDAVAVHAAADVVCAGFDASAYRNTGDEGWQSWDPARRAWLWDGSSEGLLPTTPIPVEAYPGPLFLSHGEKDRVWSAAMTHRIEERRRNAGREVEAHYFLEEDHSLRSEAENEFNLLLLNFLRRTMPTKDESL